MIITPNIPSLFFRSTKMNKFIFTVPPEQPVIYDTNGIVTMKHVGPYNEGSDLILTCEVSGGKCQQSILILI